MSWSDKLERRLGFLAVPGLLRYVAALTALVFIIYKMVDPSYLTLLDLNPVAVREGQVWRLVTYIFIPQLGSLIPAPDWFNAAFSVLFLIWVGDRLEDAWGSFRLTLFFLIGMIGTTIAAFFFGAAFSNSILISSIFFAFARFYPDVVIFFAYILPLKVKWIAWGYAAYLFFQFIFGSMQFRSAVIVALANYFIFFGRDIWNEARQRREVSSRRQRFEADVSTVGEEPLHKCKVCGATEASDPNLEFRVARDGEEYCMAHLPKVASPAS
jgi:membrane associated rhomboid family serine protease